MQPGHPVRQEPFTSHRLPALTVSSPSILPEAGPCKNRGAAPFAPYDEASRRIVYNRQGDPFQGKAQCTGEAGTEAMRSCF